MNGFQPLEAPNDLGSWRTGNISSSWTHSDQMAGKSKIQKWDLIKRKVLIMGIFIMGTFQE